MSSSAAGVAPPRTTFVASAARWLAPRLFASVGTEQRTRRPADVLTVVASAVLVAGAAADSAVPSAFDLPSWCRDLAIAVFAGSGLYAAAIVALAVLANDQRSLARDLLSASSGAVVLGALLGRTVDGTWPALVGLGDRGAFPIVRLAFVCAVLTTARPHLVRPARRLGWVLLAGCASVGVVLELGTPREVVGAAALGFAVAAVTHLVWGSPVGAPPPPRVRDALAQLGIVVATMSPDPRRHRGVAIFDVVDDSGRNLRVKVYGRDAADTRLLVSAWRLVWYRDRTSTLTFTRREQADHEALATILAQRAGVPAPDVVVAGSSSRGDALVATTWPGRPVGNDVTDEQAISMWRALDELAGARIAHGRIEPDRLRVAEGEVLLTDWDDATIGAGDERLLADGAALLVTIAALRGGDDAVRIATTALPQARLASIVPMLQPAALSVGLRRRVKDEEIDLDALRQAAAEAGAVEDPELAKLRRVSLGSVLSLAAALLGLSILVASLSDVGWDALLDSMESASWAGLALALVVGQLPRVGQAFSTIGASPKVLPLGPTTILQMAITFVNLVVPSSAARVATVVRYQQRFGVPPADAVVAGALDSASGFVVQLVLLLLCFGFGLSDLHLDLDGATTGVLDALLAFLAICVVLGLASLLLAKVRRLVADGVRSALEGVRRLKNPQRAAAVFGGNLAAELLFATTLGLTAHAFGHDVAFFDLVAVTVAVGLFAGLLPIPGGVGVAESGLTLGLTAAGVPEVDALAIALSYRAATFYLPPIWGAVALRWLRRHQYL